MRASVWALLMAAGAGAQTEPAPARPWSLGPVGLSGLLDAYYSLNLNRPASGVNALRNFDTRADRPTLSMAGMTLEKADGPVGFRMDFGFGKAFDIMHSADQPEAFRYIEQAYIDWKLPHANGWRLDFGKFDSSAGAEVIDTSEDWNYSRSLLFVWACPYYHFGLRASGPVTQRFSAGVQLVNGWNDVVDNNGGKTAGLTGTFTLSSFSWSNTYYAGPERPGTNRGWRHLYDTVLQVKPAAGASFYVNFDYGMDRRIEGGANRWTGVAGAARFAPARWFAVSPRLEWFDDADGFATGMAQVLKEFTLTAEFKMRQGLVARPEYRCDWSNRPFFERGDAAGAGTRQQTVVLGLVAYFGRKR